MSAILNLAVKQNEVKRKFRDILNVCYYIRCQEPLRIDEKFWEFKSLIIRAEFMILRSLNFDTNIVLPHHLCIIILHQIEIDMVKSLVWEMKQFQRLCQASLAVISETFLDDIVIPTANDWSSKKDHAWNIAIASVYLATQIVNLKYKSFERFVKDWGNSDEIVNSIMEKQSVLLQNI